MSNTEVIYPIVTVLVKAEEIIGSQRDWHPVNNQQALFLQEFFLPCRQESLSIAEIESIASFTSDEINRFLRERGFQIKLSPLQQQEGWREFGVASVLDLLVEWLEPGTETTLKAQNQQVYPAARLGAEVSSFYQSTYHNYPIALLRTKSSDLVYITRLDGASTDVNLLSYIQRLADSLEPVYDYDGVIFPMVDLKQKEDISWLLDLKTTDSQNETVKITQALQETRLTMNQQGARAESAVAIGFAAAGAIRSPQPDLLIDGPFLVWFQRPGLTRPLFAGHIREESWKDPGQLVP